MRLGLVLTVGVLAGCQPAPVKIGSGPPPAEPSPSAPAPAAPQPVAAPDAAFDFTDPVWLVTDFGALMFAPRNSGDIHIDMSCGPNGTMSIWAPNSEEDGRRLFLVSGGESEMFPATRIPADDEGYEGVASRIEIAASNHVLAAFRVSGQLSRGNVPDVMNAKTPGEMQSINSFFADCVASPD